MTLLTPKKCSVCNLHIPLDFLHHIVTARQAQRSYEAVAIMLEMLETMKPSAHAAACPASHGAVLLSLPRTMLQV